ncbi:MAG: WD40 repeat domain-containing protein, partial [Candidatus Promineifilaceae bacterium]
MKTKLLTWVIFCLIFVGVGCSGDESAATPSATAVSQVIVPTETAVPPTATTEPMPAVTETAVPPPTLEPTPSPTLPPPPTGSVLFLWDSEAPPIEGAERNHTLYLAQPGESVAMWDVQPVLNDLFGFPILDVSPDNTRLMFTNIEDANGDGAVSDASVDRGGDGYVLYVYEFASGQSEKLPIGLYNPHNPAWLSDESLTYRGGVTVYLVRTDGLPGQEIAVFPDTIHWIAPSPDGSLIAVNSSGLTSFIDVDTGELISVTGQLGSNSVDAVWSPDGQWLALNHRNHQLLLINVDTLEVSLVEAAGEVSYVSWSPDSLQLLLVKIE